MGRRGLLMTTWIMIGLTKRFAWKSSLSLLGLDHQPGLFTQAILIAAKDLPCLGLRQILRCAQNDRNALFMNNPG